MRLFLRKESVAIFLRGVLNAAILAGGFLLPSTVLLYKYCNHCTVSGLRFGRLWKGGLAWRNMSSKRRVFGLGPHISVWGSYLFCLAFLPPSFRLLQPATGFPSPASSRLLPGAAFGPLSSALRTPSSPAPLLNPGAISPNWSSPCSADFRR